MQIMPVPFWIGKGELLYQRSFLLKIRYHLLYGDVVVRNGRSLSKTGPLTQGERYQKYGLMGFGAFRYGKGVTKFEPMRPVAKLHEIVYTKIKHSGNQALPADTIISRSESLKAVCARRSSRLMCIRYCQ